MGEFGSALLNVILLVVGIGLLTALFGLPGMIGGFAFIALAFTVGNVGAIGFLTALAGALVVLLAVGIAITMGDDPRASREDRERELRERQLRGEPIRPADDQR